MDGTPTSRMNDWMLKSLAAGKIDLGSSTATADAQLPEPKPITLKLDEPSKAAIKTAIKNHGAELAKHKVSVLQYNGYGKDLCVLPTKGLAPDDRADQILYMHAGSRSARRLQTAGRSSSCSTRTTK